MIVRIAVSALIAAIAISGCSSVDEATGSGSTAPPTSIGGTLPAQPGQGSVAEYLNTFDADSFNGIGLPRAITTERERPVIQFEDGFVAAVREDPAREEVGSLFADLDDPSLIYLGYLYCAAYDASSTIAPSIAAVVDVVARSNGRPPTEPADDDFIATVTIVNHASGSLCPELYLETQDFLASLLGTE